MWGGHFHVAPSGHARPHRGAATERVARWSAGQTTSSLVILCASGLCPDLALLQQMLRQINRGCCTGSNGQHDAGRLLILKNNG